MGKDTKDWVHADWMGVASVAGILTRWIAQDITLLSGLSSCQLLESLAGKTDSPSEDGPRPSFFQERQTGYRSKWISPE